MSLKFPTILTVLGASGMALCTFSCAHANTLPHGSEANLTYGLWGTLGFIPAALLFCAGALWLLIATLTGPRQTQ